MENPKINKLNMSLDQIIYHNDYYVKESMKKGLSMRYSYLPKNSRDLLHRLNYKAVLANWYFEKSLRGDTHVVGILMNGTEWESTSIQKVNFTYRELYQNCFEVSTRTGSTYILPLNYRKMMSRDWFNLRNCTWEFDADEWDYNWVGTPLYDWSFEQTCNGSSYLVGYLHPSDRRQYATRPVRTVVPYEKDDRIYATTGYDSMYELEFKHSKYHNSGFSL